MALHDVTFSFGMLFSLLAIPGKLITLIIPWWAYTEISFFGETWKSNLGLWKWCRKVIDAAGDSSSTCRTFAPPDDYIVTSRSMIVFAFLLLCIGLVTVAAQHWCLQELVLLGFLGPLTICVAGILTWIATVRYAENYVKIPGNRPHDIHGGWMLALITSVFCYVSGIFFVMTKLCRKGGSV